MYFGQFVRCENCYNEFKFIVRRDPSRNEHWMRRFNSEEHFYNENWEKVNTFPNEWNSKVKKSK